jgi:hypothetical protein
LPLRHAGGKRELTLSAQQNSRKKRKKNKKDTKKEAAREKETITRRKLEMDISLIGIFLSCFPVNKKERKTQRRRQIRRKRRLQRERWGSTFRSDWNLSLLFASKKERKKERKADREKEREAYL